MPGLVPGIHAAVRRKRRRDTRNKSGYDDMRARRAAAIDRNELPGPALPGRAGGRPLRLRRRCSTEADRRSRFAGRRRSAETNCRSRFPGRGCSTQVDHPGFRAHLACCLARPHSAHRLSCRSDPPRPVVRVAYPSSASSPRVPPLLYRVFVPEYQGFHEKILQCSYSQSRPGTTDAGRQRAAQPAPPV